METKLLFNSKEYQFKRYPKTEDRALRAWSNAELLALDYIADKNKEQVHLFNDRFGIWNCVLSDKKPVTVWTYASQQKAIEQNLKLNNLTTDIVCKTPLQKLEKVALALIKIPKSLELFELFLQQIHKAADENTEVVCGFMTKHFSASLLKIATQYFEEVEQSKAWKKSRLLILKAPKKRIAYKTLINKLTWGDVVLRQFYGVFSSTKIDVGTQYLLENLQVRPDELKIIDLASGNGIIAFEATKQNLQAEVTLVDDFNLAISSSELNLIDKKAKFICSDTLENLEGGDYDLVVSNPPFHFEYENNIEISIALFKGVKKCLKPKGRFLLVANSHLNYKTHLNTIFSDVLEVCSNKKFVIYECFR